MSMTINIEILTRQGLLLDRHVNDYYSKTNSHRFRNSFLHLLPLEWMSSANLNFDFHTRLLNSLHLVDISYSLNIKVPIRGL
jgi:hypothetical protein